MLSVMRFPSAPDRGVSLRTEASGPVDADLAWLRYAEPTRWPGWAPQLSRVEYGPERLTPGTPGRVFAPGGLWLRFWIEDVDEAARTWTWTVRRGPVSVALQHGVVATEAGSRTWLAIRGPAPLVGPYLPLAKWALHRLVSLPPS